MTVVVKNEAATPWVFDKSGGKRQVAPGDVQVISDEEWESVITAKRGPGGLNPVWPTSADSNTANITRFDYYLVGASYEVHYLGIAITGTLDNANKWTIKKFAHTTLGGTNFVAEIQVMNNVAWTDRATLGWT